ncbi:hypothetical protein BU25DRAFT_405079 [Macroventuria anomochaeta]|uniref:Uncharacterized protein n=1 Tax=Macroventuria anomochaeta TaxID=301207 RepID=A0ACB6SGQ3_9PLEO|nr:uncharacterized protein BU25DRAFT_405079 [Macroventuria anomochaeta]KAF2633137.1 hypothetical protein BU25DRAFT_405079 [Macroventuria anomochaeta]
MPPRRRRGPTWGLLDPGAILNGSEAPKLLGRIVVDLDFPLSGYVPENPKEILGAFEEPMEVTSCDVQQQISASTSTQVQARITQLFGIEAAKQQQAGRQVGAHTVITRLLRQHYDYYDTLIAKHRSDVVALLERQANKRGYMITGIKSCVDAEIEASAGSGTTTGLTMEVPVQQAIAAFGAANTLGDMANPTVTVNIQNMHSVLSRFVAKGERIFSLQVREVRYQGFIHKEPRMREISQFNPDRAMFGDRKAKVPLYERAQSSQSEENGAAGILEKEALPSSVAVIEMSDGVPTKSIEETTGQEEVLELTDGSKADAEMTLFAELAF